MDAKLIVELADSAKLQPIYSDSRFPPSLYYRFLRLLAQAKRPKWSVELGLCGGGASLHLILGWPDGNVVGVDRSNDYPENIGWMLETFPKFQFWRMDSVASADVFVKSGHEVDILFIDTIHTYEQTTKELNAYLPVMAPGAIVVLDDLFVPGMDEVWVKAPGVRVRLDHLHDSTPGDGGFGVVLL